MAMARWPTEPSIHNDRPPEQIDKRPLDEEINLAVELSTAGRGERREDDLDKGSRVSNQAHGRL